MLQIIYGNIVKIEIAIWRGGRYMRKMICIVVSVCFIFLTGCGRSEKVKDSPSKLQENVSDTSVFVSGMGCSDTDCMDLSHYHNCPPDCEDYEHHHNCPLDCEDYEHHHNCQLDNEDYGNYYNCPTDCTERGHHHSGTGNAVESEHHGERHHGNKH